MMRRINAPGRRIGKEELMEMGQRLRQKPTLSLVIPFQQAIYREFGNLREYQAVLGYEPNPLGRPKLRPTPRAAGGEA